MKRNTFASQSSLTLFALLFLTAFIAFTPLLASAYNPLTGDTQIIPCGRAQPSTDPKADVVWKDHPCDFGDLVTLAKNIMDFIMFFSIPLSAILFAYAGFRLIFSGGNETEIKKAKAIFWDVVIGLVVVLAAWLIVYTIATALVSSSDGNYFRFIQKPQ